MYPGAHVQLGRQRNPLSHSSPTSTIPFPQYCAVIIVVIMLRQNEPVTVQFSIKEKYSSNVHVHPCDVLM